jgi:hypothetical protein
LYYFYVKSHINNKEKRKHSQRGFEVASMLTESAVPVAYFTFLP